jgi:hypothetical protein
MQSIEIMFLEKIDVGNIRIWHCHAFCCLPDMATAVISESGVYELLSALKQMRELVKQNNTIVPA